MLIMLIDIKTKIDIASRIRTRQSKNRIDANALNFDNNEAGTWLELYLTLGTRANDAPACRHEKDTEKRQRLRAEPRRSHDAV